MNRYLLAVFAAGVWMNLSEFIRNELLLKNTWVDGFKDIGLSFPSDPLNGAVWALWAFIFVAVLTLISTKFDVIVSTIISWSLGFVLLWVAVWNMGILPSGLLYWAVPWSFVEVYVAALIISRIVVQD
jgi:hypothetical protein